MVHVLAVEDSPTQAARLCADLEAAGFDVTLAASGAEAVRLLEQDPVYDVIASDVVMPGMTGYDLCRHVKDDPRLREIPVLLLTSLTDPLEVVNGLESGADNFIRKPYDNDQLMTRLRAAVHNRELRKSGRLQVGVQLSFLDREFDITADRQQILDLLISTFEELVVTSRAVQTREAELEQAHSVLERQLQSLELERQRLRAVVEAVPVALFVTGPDGLVTHASNASTHTLHVEADDLRGRGLDEVVRFVDGDGRVIPVERLPHHQVVEALRPLSSGDAFDVFVERGDGTRVPVMLQASPVLDEHGRAAGSVSTAHALGGLTEHDPLTGLPNSAAFLDRAAGVLNGPHGNVGLLVLQLDRPELAQASLGAQAEREMLVEVARHLRETFASAPPGVDAQRDIFVAYLGGVRFGALVANLPDSFRMLHLAETARRAISGTWTVSVGVAVDDGTGGPQLFAAANAALRQARESGGNRVELLGPAASQDAMDRLELEMDLRAAVERDEIELYYQPEYHLATGELGGFEALARWHHPRHGAVPPPVFIGLAEQSGLIRRLGAQLMRKACVQMRAWADLGFTDLSVAVNVSVLQLRTGFAEDVLAVLAETGLSPRQLMLELTETAALRDPEITIPIVEDLRRHGVRFALDDFGTGYSSMTQLTRIRFDQLKLDRSFTAAIDLPGPDAVVGRSIISLGHALDIPVLAEGVETNSQAEKLRQLGCDLCQGFLFARPMPADDVTEMLHREGAVAARR